MTITVNQLRDDLDRLIDEVIETGRPLEIEHNGHRVVIRSADSKLARLVPHPDFINGDPEDLVSLDWSGEWNP